MASGYGRVPNNEGIPNGTGTIPGGFAVAPGSAARWGGGPVADTDPISWAQGHGTQTQLQQSLSNAPSATHVMDWGPKGDQLRITMTASILKQLGDFSRILTLRNYESDVAYTWEIKVVPQSTMSSIAPFGNAPYVTQHRERRSVVLQMWGKQALIESAVHAHTGEGEDLINDAASQLRNDAASTLVLQGFDALLRSPSHAGVYTTNQGRSRTANMVQKDKNDAVWNFAAAQKQERAVDMMVTAAGRNLGVYGSTPRALVACFGLHQYVNLTPASTTYAESGPDKTPNGFLDLLNARKTVSGLSLHESMNMNVDDRATMDPMTRNVAIGEHAPVALSEGFHTVRLMDDSKGRGAEVSVADALEATHLFDARGQLRVGMIQSWLDSMQPQERLQALRFTPLVGRIWVGSRPTVVAAAFIGQMDEQYLNEARVAAFCDSMEAALAKKMGETAYADAAANVKRYASLFSNASYDANCHVANKAWAATARSANRARLAETFGMPDLESAIVFLAAGGTAVVGAPGGSAAAAAGAINRERGVAPAGPVANFSALDAANGNVGLAAIQAAFNDDEFAGDKSDLKRVGEAPGGWHTFPGLRHIASMPVGSAVSAVYRPVHAAAGPALSSLESIVRNLKEIMPSSVLFQPVVGSPFTQFCSADDAAMQTVYHVLAGSQSPIFITLSGAGGVPGADGAIPITATELMGLGVQKWAGSALDEDGRKALRNAAIRGLMDLEANTSDNRAARRQFRNDLATLGGAQGVAMRIALGRSYSVCKPVADSGNGAAQATLGTMKDMLTELLRQIAARRTSPSAAADAQVNTSVAAFNAFLSSVGGTVRYDGGDVALTTAGGAAIAPGVAQSLAGAAAGVRIPLAGITDIKIVRAVGGAAAAPNRGYLVATAPAGRANIAIPVYLPGHTAGGAAGHRITVATPLAMTKPSAEWAAAKMAERVNLAGAAGANLADLGEHVSFCGYDPTSLPELRGAFDALLDVRAFAGGRQRGFVRDHGTRLAMGHHFGGDGGFADASHLIDAEHVRSQAREGYAEILQQAFAVGTTEGFKFGPQAYLPKLVLARVFNGEPSFGALGFFANIDKTTISAMAYASVRQPFDLAVIRPFMTYTMGSAVVTDYKVGLMLYSFVNMGMGEDVTNKATTMNLTMKSACAVVRPTALQLLPYVLCLGYVRGGSLEPFRHDANSLPFNGRFEAARRDRAAQMTMADAAYYAAVVPAGACDDEQDWADPRHLFQYMFALRRNQNLVSSSQPYPKRVGDNSVCYPAGIQVHVGSGDRSVRKSPSRTPFGDFPSFKACNLAHTGRWGGPISKLDAPDTARV